MYIVLVYRDTGVPLVSVSVQHLAFENDMRTSPNLNGFNYPLLNLLLI